MSKVNLIQQYVKETFEVQFEGDVFMCTHESDSHGKSKWYVMSEERMVLDDDSFIFTSVKKMCKQYLLNKNTSL
jgi:hypothetical protein